MAINLLPWRELQMKKRIQRYFFILVSICFLISMVTLILRYSFHLTILEYEAKNNHLAKIIAEMKFPVETKKINEKFQMLSEQTELIKKINLSNADFWKIFNNLGKNLPDHIQIKQLIWSNLELHLTGMTLRPEQIADLIQALEESSLFSQVIMEGVNKDDQSENIQFSIKAIPKV